MERLTTLFAGLLLTTMVGVVGCNGDDDEEDDTGLGDVRDMDVEDGVEPDTAPDTVADTVADTAPDTAPDTEPDTAADTAPDTTADTGADTAADTAPDTTADTTGDAADATDITPSVRVMDQTVSDLRTVNVNEVVSDGPGWMVIHEEATDAEQPGEVVGWSSVDSGTTEDVTVEIDRDIENDETLYAMLHNDTGEIGTYEFNDGGGEDGPVQAEDGGIVVDPFTVFTP